MTPVELVQVLKGLCYPEQFLPLVQLFVNCAQFEPDDRPSWNTIRSV